MTKTIWSPEARLDLRSLTTYLRQRSPSAADAARRELFAAADMLTRFPEMGRLGAACTRERSVPRWRKIIVYRIVNGRIEVVALRDTSRDVQP